MKKANEIDLEIRQLEKKLDELRSRKEALSSRKNERNRLEEFRREARTITKHMDDWQETWLCKSESTDRFLVKFFGACAGEWAARTRYQGDLPGFGGFLVRAGRTNIVVDPGEGTFRALLSERIAPHDLDHIIVTHGHWDCVRDLNLLVMAACRTGMESRKVYNDKLSLYAEESVLDGLPMHPQLVMRASKRNRDLDESDQERTAKLRTLLPQFRNMFPSAMSSYDLFFRLGGRFVKLEPGMQQQLSNYLWLYTRKSYHAITYGGECIPALDFVLREKETWQGRVVYLTDTEYRHDLASAYAEDKDLPPIDILICNVKTLDVLSYPTEHEYAGYTRKHLGWKGVVQLTRDLQELGSLRKDALVVLRAWGIETVTSLDEKNRRLVATPQKLEVYESEFRRLTNQRTVIPNLTEVGFAVRGPRKIQISHQQRPFLPQHVRGCHHFGNVFYRSKQMCEVELEALKVIDQPEQSIIISGETGVGKDALARAIHNKGRRTGEFRSLNARALVGDLALGQLAGHQKGTFTSAVEDRKGLLSKIGPGTLVLEEAADLLPDHQTLLLPIIENRKFCSLGSSKEETLRAQIIMTTNKDIPDLVRKGLFREDYVARVFHLINIPPLRERLEDIEAILDGWRTTGIYDFPTLSDESIEALKHFEWPGNVRQLIRILKKARMDSDFSADHLCELIKKDLHQPFEHAKSEHGTALDPEEGPEEALLDALRRRGLSSREQMERELGWKYSKTLKYLNALVEKRLAKKIGRGPTTRYRAT